MQVTWCPLWWEHRWSKCFDTLPWRTLRMTLRETVTSFRFESTTRWFISFALMCILYTCCCNQYIHICTFLHILPIHTVDMINKGLNLCARRFHIINRHILTRFNTPYIFPYTYSHTHIHTYMVNLVTHCLLSSSDWLHASHLMPALVGT